MRSIRQRLTLSLLTGLGALIVSGGFFVYYSTAAALRRELDARLEANLRAVSVLVRQDHRELEIDHLGLSVGGFELGGRVYYQILNGAGEVMAQSRSVTRGEDLRRGFEPGEAAGEPGFWNVTLTNGTPLRVTGMRFVPLAKSKSRKSRPPPTPVGPGLESTVLVAADLSPYHGTLAQLARVLWSGGILALLLTPLLVQSVLTRGLRALERVGGQAAAISADNLEVRFTPDQMPAELRPICMRLNELLARLQASFERERRFSADVAHELRTPIAELRSLCEVALKWPDGESQRAALEDGLAVSRQMEGVVTSLLAITRCENGRQGLTRETLRIGRLVEELWQPVREKAEGRGLKPSFSLDPDDTVTSDRNLFALILANLLSNAVDYAPRDSGIQVSHEQRNGVFTLTVSNPAEDLAPEDIPRLSERFWRKNAARSASEHAGLGLALARACADSLALKLEAELTASGQLRMTLSGPR